MDIIELEFNEKCINCGEPLKGFIVFGKHTPRKIGGDVEFKEFIYKKRIEDQCEILSMLVRGQCTCCNITNFFKCDYNIEKGNYRLLDVNF